MTRNNLKELLDVLEKIRAKDYPDIPKELIEKIVLAQYEKQDNRGEARDETIKTVLTYINENV